MTDNRARAEKIDDGIYNHPFDTEEERVLWITAQIDDAVREVRAERDKTFVGVILRAKREGAREGFAAGIEKAAGVINDHYWDSMTGSRHGEFLIQTIRALKADR